MRSFGSSGWRLSLYSDQATHLILYVRDACQLNATGYDVPPPLVGEIEIVELGLSLEDQRTTSEEWLSWWRRFIHVESQVQLDFRSEEERGDLDGRAARTVRTSVFDPLEEFQSLRETPLLRDAARKSWRQGAKWTKMYQSREVGRGLPIARTVAESFAQQRQVSPERVGACVLLLNVTGKWSCLSEPGVLLCSYETFKDEVQFEFELEGVFESGLNRPSD